MSSVGHLISDDFGAVGFSFALVITFLSGLREWELLNWEARLCITLNNFSKVPDNGNSQHRISLLSTLDNLDWRVTFTTCTMPMLGY